MSLFRRGPERGDVEAQLERVRGLVEILTLSRANLSAVEAVVQDAERNLAVGDTVRARAACERAERIATALEVDYQAARGAVQRLREHVARMKSMGMPVEGEERALEAVHAAATSTREWEGAQVPDYAAARALAVGAESQAAGRLALADQTTDAIFSAEMAIEGAAEALGGSNEELREPQNLLERARADVSRGNLELAVAGASAALRLATDAVDRRREAHETLESVERISASLRSFGIPIGSVTRALDLGRSLLAKGKLVAAIDVFNEAAQEALRLGQTYRQLLDAMTEAGKIIDALREDRLPTEEAVSAIERARVAMKAGNYQLATTCAQDVGAADKRQRDMRENLRSQIATAKARIEGMKELGLAYVNDAEEMVGKAERAFTDADYAGTSEDLRIAALLLEPARKGAPREGAPVAR